MRPRPRMLSIRLVPSDVGVDHESIIILYHRPVPRRGLRRLFSSRDLRPAPKSPATTSKPAPPASLPAPATTMASWSPPAATRSLAWSFTCGTYNGADLTGVHAMAAVTCDQTSATSMPPARPNWSSTPAPPKRRPPPSQACLRKKSSADLGKIVTVRRAPITFSHAVASITLKPKALPRWRLSRCPTTNAAPSPIWSGTPR